MSSPAVPVTSVWRPERALPELLPGCAALLALGVAVAYLLAPDGAGGAAFTVLAASTIAAPPVALALHRPQVRWPLWALTASGPLFLAGIALRSIPVDLGGLWPALSRTADVWTMVGYAAMAAFVYGMIGARERRDRAAALDAASIGFAGALVVWAVLVNPVISQHTGSGLLRFAEAACPMADAVILFLLTRVYMSRRARPLALRLVTAGLSLMFVGDVGYMVRAVTGWPIPEHLLSVWFVMAFVAVAVGVLQPDVTAMLVPSGDEPARTDPSGVRLVMILVAMLVPLSVMGAWRSMSPALTVIGVGLALAQIGTTFARLTHTLRALGRQERTAQLAARTDELTGLANRRGLTEALTRCSTTGVERGLVLVDVADFSSLNESWGPQVGDEALTTLGAALQAALHGEESAARVEADLFAVLVPGPSDLAARARQLLGALPTSMTLAGPGTVPVTLHAGCAGKGANADELLRNATLATTAAKEADAAVVAYDPRMHEQVARRLAVVSRLRGALCRGELKVAYQPLFASPGQTLVGFEALLRWECPELGPVSPAEFIPIAEETGLIVELGEWVLDQATAQLRELRGLPGMGDLHVAVNVAPRQLLDGGLVARVAGALGRSGVRPDRLWLEITESALMSSPQQAAAVLHRLKELGVVLALDDFGTGHSSLAHLSTFPVDVLKLDRVFTQKLGTVCREVTVTEASIDLAHRMDMTVVAEGVETLAQLEALDDLGCDILQGFLLGKPQVPTAGALCLQPA